MKYITLLVFTLALKLANTQITLHGSISRIYKVSLNDITYNGSALNEPFIFSLTTPQGNYCEKIRLE